MLGLMQLGECVCQWGPAFSVVLVVRWFVVAGLCGAIDRNSCGWVIFGGEVEVSTAYRNRSSCEIVVGFFGVSGEFVCDLVSVVV